jgi:RimJ/RimL family protein N-acetyltransferase
MKLLPLETPRLILRELQETDLQPFTALGSDREVTRCQDYILVESEGEALAWVQRAVAQNQAVPRPGYHLAVIRKEDGAWLGYFGFGKTEDPSSGEIEFGYAIHKQYWGIGFATEALKAVLDFCFLELEAAQVFGECDQDNPASGRVMEKAGLRFERSYPQVNERTGQTAQMLRYSTCKPDWENAKAQSRL